jgi:hypothetical protein
VKKVIVTTTINAPTEAIRKFDALEDWELVVIGDQKTPKDYRLERGTYYDPSAQEEIDKELSDVIGWNCIQRRNFGLLVALERGADVVALIDDDNIPKPGWGNDLLVGRTSEINFYETDLPCFDPIGVTNYPELWHRGYPLQLLAQRVYNEPKLRPISVDVQADFWDGDPDIDAICRMEHAPECVFDSKVFPFASNAISPFNSQNTFLHSEVLADYFLFPHIGRMDDIWASFYVQAKGRKVAFAKASVYQERNEHDLIKDMVQEYLGYENNLHLVTDLARDPDAIISYLPGRAVRAFDLYRRHFARG